jgi:F-type H+-transporting ATPase subunit b
MNLLAILAAEDPTQTHHWLWPEGNELLWGTLAFLIVFAGLWKYALPQFKKAYADRTARIQKELDDAAAAKAEADDAARHIREAKGDIEGERARILAEADAEAVALVEVGRERLTQELADLEAKAETDIRSAGGRVHDELQAEVARIASGAMERLVADGLDEATQVELVEQFIARVGSASGGAGR